MTSTRNLIIIGSGPAGYTAAVYAARAGLRPQVIEGSTAAGGALMTTTDIENFPGFPEAITGPELIERMRMQAARFDAEFLHEDAVAADLTSPVKTVRTADGTTHRAHAVIVATGGVYRRLRVPGEDRLSGRGVSWCATCDGFFFRGKSVAVIGGGDSAMEEATFLTRFADRVTVIHRRGTLRASRTMQDRAYADPKIQVIWNTAIDEVHGQQRVEALTMRNVLTQELRSLPVDGVFIAVGHDPRAELLLGQIDLDDAGYALVGPGSTATSAGGVFAAGDLVDRRYRQAITASASGCAAALDAERYLAHLGVPV